jgi:hypothetical protein
MKQDVKHHEVFARQETLGDDFALILEAFADAFRGLSPASTQACSCPIIHYAGWR